MAEFLWLLGALAGTYLLANLLFGLVVILVTRVIVENLPPK